MAIKLTVKEDALLTSIESIFGNGSLEWNAAMDMIKYRSKLENEIKRLQSRG